VWHRRSYSAPCASVSYLTNEPWCWSRCQGFAGLYFLRSRTGKCRSAVLGDASDEKCRSAGSRSGSGREVPVGRSASTTVAEHIGAQQRHSDPDDEEADPPRRRHRLAEDRDAEDELECRGAVLEHAHPRQGDAPCSRAEEDERDGRGGTGDDDDDDVPGAEAGERLQALGTEEDEVGGRGDGENEALDGHALERSDPAADLVLHQAVEAERQ